MAQRRISPPPGIPALLFALLLTACSPSPDAMLASAKDYLAKNDINAASIQLKNALQEDAGLAEARFLLGKINLEQGNVAGAIKELQRALELGYGENEVLPLLARARIMNGEFDKVVQTLKGKTLSDPKAQVIVLTALGSAHLGKAEMEEASAVFESALKLAPDDLDARIGLGRAKLFSGKAEAAQQDAEAIVKADPGNGDAYALLADALLAQSRIDEAIGALEQAVAARPDNVGFRYALVSLLFGMRKTDAAVAAIESLKKIAPTHPSTRYLQALADFEQNRLPEARDGVLLALKSAPDMLPANLLAGSVFLRLNEMEQARTYLGKVIDRVPSHLAARRMLAASYLATRDPGRALSIIQPLLDADTRDPTVLSLAGQIQMANGDAEKAQEYYARMVELAPEDATARTRLAITRFAGGQTTAAFADLETAVALDKEDAYADVVLVLAHMERRDFGKALEAQAQLEKKKPNSAQTFNLKGGIYLGLNDLAKARLAFEKALELQPDALAVASNLVRLDLAERKPEQARARYLKLIERNPKNVDVLIAYSGLQTALRDPPADILDTLDRAAGADPVAVGPMLALARYQLGRNEAAAAIAAAQKAATAQPGNPMALELLAMAQVAKGDRQQAIASLEKLVSLQPQSPRPLVLLAEGQRANADLAGAERSLRKAIELRPDYIDAQRRLINLLLERDAGDEALTLARTVQAQRPQEATGYQLEGDIHSAANKRPEAVQSYRKALAKARSGDNVRRLHSALVRDDKRAEADRLAEDWLRAEPTELVMRGYLAELALAENRYADALRIFKRMYEISPKNPLLLNNLAWTAGQLKDPQALGYAEEALAAAPESAAVLDTVGVIQVEAGQTEKGLANLTRAVSLAPDSLPLRFNLAKTYAKVGRKDDARRELDVLMPKLKEGTQLHSDANALLRTL